MTDKPESSTFPGIKVRIETLSDLVFGLALTFGSLILIGSQPKTGTDLLGNVFIFGFSFVIVVMTWIGYSRTIAVLPREVPFSLALNLALLFCVPLEPYLFYLLMTAQTAALADAATIGYALDVGTMFLLLAGLAYILVKEEKSRTEEHRRLHPIVLMRFNRIMRLEALVGGIYLASALPIFWLITTPIGPLRFVLWLSPFIIISEYRNPKKRKKA